MLSSTRSAGIMKSSSSEIVLPRGTCVDCRDFKFCSSSRALDEASSTDITKSFSSSMAICESLKESTCWRAVMVASSAATALIQLLSLVISMKSLSHLSLFLDYVLLLRGLIVLPTLTRHKIACSSLARCRRQKTFGHFLEQDAAGQKSAKTRPSNFSEE